MSKVKSKKTKFEIEFIFSLKRNTRLKFETNVTDLQGKPDIVFRKQKVCIFLDSDFWHGWQFPRWKHKMKNKFWVDKITNNRRRDTLTTKKLRSQGWQVVRIWEHQLRNDKELNCAKKVVILLKDL